MKPEIYLLTISLPLITAIIVFAMKYASSYAAARAKIAEQNELTKLAEAQSAELAQIKDMVRVMAGDLAGQSRAIAGIETILKQVG
ncbi:MAG: hypothetical protein MUF41_04860 [Sphingopyxis sp.]|jgi:hypothetical protein|nr:hypothetical protein [Sphingopyxis sp.]